MLDIDLWSKIVDAVHEKSMYHFNMLGAVDRDTCAEYLAFYALHGGMYWSERGGEIQGVATAHPNKRDFDWKWSPEDGIWTAHLVWSNGPKSHVELLTKFLNHRKHVKQLWAWRRQEATLLDPHKIERILSYGRRRNQNPSTASAKLRTIHEGCSGGAAQVCPAGISG